MAMIIRDLQAPLVSLYLLSRNNSVQTCNLNV